MRARWLLARDVANDCRTSMTRREAWAIVAHGVPTIGLLLQGLLYVATSRFMPYHAEALGGITWEELPPHYQAFVLGVIKAMGAGSIGVTVALIIMLSIPATSARRPNSL